MHPLLCFYRAILVKAYAPWLVASWMRFAINVFRQPASLVLLQKEAGFHDIGRMGFDTSALGGFSAYLLDVNEDGSPYKGVSSLYMECGK